MILISVLGEDPRARMFRVQFRQIDGGAGSHVVPAGFRRPIEQARDRLAHMPSIANRANAELACDDVIRQGRNVVLGDLAGDLFAEPGAEEAPADGWRRSPSFRVGVASRRQAFEPASSSTRSAPR